MRKLKMIIAVVVICLSGNVFGQDSTNTIMLEPKWKSNSVGKELQLAYKQHSNGFGIMLLGGGLIFVGSQIDQINKPLTIGGSIAIILGSCIMLNSNVHIKRAGVLLDERGIGLKIKI